MILPAQAIVAQKKVRDAGRGEAWTGYRVHVNRDLLEEVDGPMPKHGLQEMHGKRLELPATRRDWPNHDRLSMRWTAFLEAS